ncbi:MAG: BolA/IbaG family iron-sulfur metabolism protein [Myxococcota bacterium]
MAGPFGHPTGSVAPQVKDAIEQAIPDAEAEVSGGDGHYSITVRSPAFDGKSRVQQQRLVYTAITPLMSGPDAPVHAVDELRTLAPEG